MSEVEVVVPPEQQPLDNPERRNVALAERLGISLNFYSQIIEDAAAHATEPRAGVPAIAPEQRWLPLGPRNVGGRITTIAQDPTNPLVLYAGSAFGGLWQTLDGGDTWEHLGDDEHNFPVAAIAIPEQDPSTLYIGTGLPVAGHASGRGLYRVTVPPPRIPQPNAARPRAVFNRLARAHPPNMSPLEASQNALTLGGSLRYTRIRMDPFDQDRFWAASQTGLWRFEPHPANGAARFILEFPPASIASGDVVPALFGGVLGAGMNFPAYASDVAVARDPRDRTPISEGSRIPRYLVIYVGIHGQGVYRGRFDRQTRDAVAWERRCDLPYPAHFDRIQLALCERTPERVYALMDVPGPPPPPPAVPPRVPTPVFRSDNDGESWRPMPPPFDAGQNQAHYNLVLEVSPTDPDVLWVGVVDGYLSRDGGANWQKVLFSREYDGTGDYAQHADQHAAFFDRFERRKLWVGHDGGLSLARDLQLPPRSPGYWRMRSHGIIGSQFQDVAVNYGANRGFMTAAGAQDNGGWMSLGGPTWIHVNVGDGAGFAFHPTLTRLFVGSHQNEHVRIRSILSTALRSFFNPVVPDLPEALAPLNAMAIAQSILAAAPGGPLTGTPSPFIPLVVQNPAAPNSIIFGWETRGMFAAANFTVNFGATIMPLPGIGAIAPAGIQASAAAFGPVNAAGRFEGWVGFTNGNLALTQDAPSGAATPWNAPATPLPWGPAIAAQTISGIAIHPTDERIVLVCTSGTPGRVFITYDRGTSWQELTARLPNAVAVTPANLNLAAGQRRQYTATANFPDGGSFDATAHAIWTTNDPTVARFSMVAGEEGQLITVAPGMVTVRARFALFGANIDGTTMLTVTAGAGAAAPLPTARRAFDLRALPPCPMTSLAFDQTNPTRVFIGTLAGVYVLPNIPVPVAPLTVTPNPANIRIGETRQLTVQCMFSDGVQRDITTEVDWSAVPAPPAVVNFGAGPLGSQVTGVAAGSTVVTARRGALTGNATVNVTAGAPPAAPPPPAAAVAPVVPVNWQPFNLGLPLTLVNDIANVPRTNVLRVATFGRGVWDCDLAATAAGAGTRARCRLFIRQTVIEDGLTYPRPFPPVPADDPRLPAGTVMLDHAHAFDIRVDAPPHRFFDDRVDGVEFDERIGAETLVPQVGNAIYVQVLNAGREPAASVRVHLYFRRSPVPAPPGPATPLPTAAGADLGNVNEFYLPPGFEPPGSPADGAIWTPVGPARMLEPVGPAAPVVARFDWAPPAALAGADVALLALCESPDDPLPPAAIAGPGVSAFVPAERRCALRILPVAALARPDLYIRAGIDDDGRSNTLAAPASTRSPDIFVVQAEPADPRAAFGDLLDVRRQDRLLGNATNHLYVRVHNRGRSTVQAEVEVMAVKVLANLHPEVPHGRWTRVGAAMVDVPANGWALAHLPFASPVDPAPFELERKYYILVALVRSTDNADPLPDRTVVTTEDQFRQFLSRQAGSDNVAARAVRWVAS